MRTLWIGSICINKSDEEEKKLMVAMVGLIFVSADSTS
jgi:hypothetical protein